MDKQIAASPEATSPEAASPEAGSRRRRPQHARVTRHSCQLILVRGQKRPRVAAV